jgi:Amt family ammonium transporter
MVGLFGVSAVSGANGLFYGGGFALFGRQALAVVVAVGWAFSGTAALA